LNKKVKTKKRKGEKKDVQTSFPLFLKLLKKAMACATIEKVRSQSPAILDQCPEVCTNKGCFFTCALLFATKKGKTNEH
jgi:hypothetical protein